VRKYPNEFSATPANNLRCQLCEVDVKYDKTFNVDSHRSTQKHKDGLRRQSEAPTTSRQTFIEAPTSFSELVVSSFLAADIPLKKLSHPAIRRLFAEAGKTLPSESAARNMVTQIADREIDRLKENVANKKVFLIVDEAEVASVKYINSIIGDIDRPSITYLAQCKVLEDNPNSQIVSQTVDDVLRMLDVDRKNFALLLTDSANYMKAAGRTLKELYPGLKQVTCLAHLLHNCAMRVRAYFTTIDVLIARLKAATIKNKERRNMFRDAQLPLPPDPVVTRWATWLRAAFYYAEHLPAVREIVESWPEDGVLVMRAQEAIRNEQLACDLVRVVQYRPLIARLEKLEAATYTIEEAYSDICNMRFNDDPCQIRQYIDHRLTHGTDLIDIIEAKDNNVAPSTYALLRKAQPTTAAVERSFSLLNKLLRKDRNFLPENVNKYILPFFNNRNEH